ncbi:MAG: ATP-binding protein [bacterium]
MQKNQKIRWVQEFIQNICDDSQLPAFVQGAIYDINTRKLAEEIISHEKNKLINILDSMKDGVVITNALYEIEYINPVFEKEFSQPKGRKCYEYLHNQPHPCLSCNFPKIILNKTVQWELYSPELQKTYDVVGVPLLNPDGSISKLDIFRDITARKKTEAALRESEERLKRLIEKVYDVIIIIDEEGNFNYVSPSIEKISGYGPEEFILNHAAKLSSYSKGRCKIWDTFQENLQKPGSTHIIEFRVQHKDGSLRIIECVGRNLLFDPVVKGIILNARDISKYKEIEEVFKKDKKNFEGLINERTLELLNTQKELEKAKRLSDIGTLAATVAHELRNPLGVIKTALYNIKRKSANSLLDKHIANIEKKIAESDQIINNLLNYSRLKMPAYKKISIFDLLEDCTTFSQNRFNHPEISIKKDVNSLKDTQIEVDPFQIREVINNILDNAYQAFLDFNVEGKIEIKGRLDVKTVTISFIDNGCGIEKEDVEKVFEPFFTKKSKGTGLGLAICRELINLHGGKIEFESKKNSGTTVTVVIPTKGPAKNDKKNPDH